MFPSQTSTYLVSQSLSAVLMIRFTEGAQTTRIACPGYRRALCFLSSYKLLSVNMNGISSFFGSEICTNIQADPAGFLSVSITWPVDVSAYTFCLRLPLFSSVLSMYTRSLSNSHDMHLEWYSVLLYSGCTKWSIFQEGKIDTDRYVVSNKV